MSLFTDDTSPGVHDTMYATCDSQFYEILTGESGQANCNDNVLAVAVSLGLSAIFVPMPVTLFQNTPSRPQGELKQWSFARPSR